MKYIILGDNLELNTLITKCVDADEYVIVNDSQDQHHDDSQNDIICLSNNVELIKTLSAKNNVMHFADDINDIDDAFLDSIVELTGNEKFRGLKIAFLPRRLIFSSNAHVQIFDIVFKLIMNERGVNYQSIFGISDEIAGNIRKGIDYKKIPLADFTNRALDANKFGGIEKLLFRFQVIGEEII